MNPRTYGKLIVISCLLSFYNLVNAQKDYEQGYIIKGNRDTLRGYIFDGGKNLFKFCSFKADPNDIIKDYYPQDIVGFRLENGKYFVSKKVIVNNEVKIYFLEYLIKGKANIYFMRDVRDYYFIEKENNEILEITEDEKTFVSKEGDSYIMPNHYKAKLKSQLSDCQDVFSEIEQTELSHSSLIKLAKDYHNRVCTNEQCVVFERKLKPVHINFGIHAGLSMNAIGFGDQLTSNYSIGNLVGCRFEFENIVSWTTKISFTIDFTFQRFSNYSLTEKEEDRLTYNGVLYMLADYNIYNPMLKPNIDVNLKALVLKIPIAINYTFLKSKIRPLIGGGFSNVLVLTQNKEFILDRFVDEYKKSIPTFHVGFVGKVGVKYMLKNTRSIYLELNYEFTQHLNINQPLRFRNNLFSVLAGFSL